VRPPPHRLTERERERERERREREGGMEGWRAKEREREITPCRIGVQLHVCYVAHYKSSRQQTEKIRKMKIQNQRRKSED
jgi:hypothetical protein